MKFQRATTTTTKLLTITLLIAHTLTDCGKNCLTCNADSSCLICFRAPFTSPTTCSPARLPQDDPCEFVMQTGQSPEGNCVLCREGYIKDDANVCIKDSSVANCLYGRKKDGKVICYACVNSFPSQSFDECLPFEKFGEEGKGDVDWSHCVWGAWEDGRYQCFRCADGFMVGESGDVCVEATIEGCLVAKSGG